MTQHQRPEEALVRLRREVLPPRDPSSSLGIIAVSSVALLFALSSSLLLFHASAIQRVPARPTTSVVVRAQPARPLPALVAPADTCQGPVYRAMPDGRAEVVFELCEPRGGSVRRVLTD
jgi:hypothetical protein